MASVLVQFHAVPEELLAFTRQSVSDFDLHVVAVSFSPFEAIEVGVDTLDSVFGEASPYWKLAFTIGAPVLPARSTMDFADKNPDAMYLSIERVGQDGLRQSSLAARTDDPAVLSTWRAIAERWKKMTRTGVVVVNPATGAAVCNRTFRYSPGAKLLASMGVPMLPVAGGNVLKFVDVGASKDH